MKPLVTIMIPTYNQDQYLMDAVESALSQTYQNKQIMVLDDCSSDTTKEVMQKYQAYPNVRYIRNDVNIGRVENYRAGLYKYAEGDWVINLDGDDFFIDNSFIEMAIALTKKDQEIVLVSADRIEVKSFDDYGKSQNEGTPTNAYKSKIVDGNKVFMGIPGKKYQIYHLTSLYNRNSALKLDFYSKNIISSDYESLYRLILGKKVAFLKLQVAAWRFHGKNESRAMDVFKLINNYELFTSVYLYACENDYLNFFKRKKWLIDASARRYYTSIISFSKDKCCKDIWILSKFMMFNYPLSFWKTLLNPKLYIRIFVFRK